MELTVKQMDVFLDENIVDKEELEARVSKLREDGKAAEINFDELTSEQKDMCSKSKLGIK